MMTHETVTLLIAILALTVSLLNLYQMIQRNRRVKASRPRCTSCGKQAILFALEPSTTDDPDTDDPDLYCEQCLENVKDWLQGLKDDPTRR